MLLYLSLGSLGKNEPIEYNYPIEKTGRVVVDCFRRKYTQVRLSKPVLFGIFDGHEAMTDTADIIE